MRIAVFGLGYVGSVSAACLARDGNQVIGVDIDQAKVDMINDGRASVEEPGLSELISAQRDAGRLIATSDVAQAVHDTEVALVAVGTPSSHDGSVQFDSAVVVAKQIGDALQKSARRYVVVVRSTLLPGILEKYVAPALAEMVGEPLGDRVHVCYHPEFLRETTAIADYDKPPFIVVGADDPKVAETVFEFYRGIDAERIVTNTRNAAMIKYACNAFHALKIDFANEIGVLSREFSADGQAVMDIVCRDRQLNISTAYLRPGFAFGGSCLPKDVRALTRFAQQMAIRTDLINALLPSNQSHLERALAEVERHGVRSVGLVGLSFKAGTDDLRESPQVWLAEQLLGRGYQVKIFDPAVNVSRLVGKNQAYVEQHLPHLASLLVEEPKDVLVDSQMLILATGVANGIPWSDLFSGPIFDLRCDLVQPSNVEEVVTE